MNDATKERLRLDALHNEELDRFSIIQEQEREHQAVHDAAIIRQKPLNEQEYEHRELTLKLERGYASTEMAVELKESILESKNAGSTSRAAVESEEIFTESGSAGSGNENPGAMTSKKGRLKVEEIRKSMARAKESVAEKRRGQ